MFWLIVCKQAKLSRKADLTRANNALDTNALAQQLGLLPLLSSTTLEPLRALPPLTTLQPLHALPSLTTQQSSRTTGLSIRGRGSHVTVLGSNFALGTSVNDITFAITNAEPSGLVSVDIVKDQPSVMAEVVFEGSEVADRIIKRFDGVFADGRKLRFEYKASPKPLRPAASSSSVGQVQQQPRRNGNGSDRETNRGRDLFSARKPAAQSSALGSYANNGYSRNGTRRDEYRNDNGNSNNGNGYRKSPEPTYYEDSTGGDHSVMDVDENPQSSYQEEDDAYPRQEEPQQQQQQFNDFNPPTGPATSTPISTFHTTPRGPRGQRQRGARYAGGRRGSSYSRN
jgi:hypothetical protein